MDARRAKSGCERLRAAIPHGLDDDHPSDRLRTGFAGALRFTGMTAPMVIKGPGDGRVACTGQMLVPTLRRAGVVIRDNLKACTWADFGTGAIRMYAEHTCRSAHANCSQTARARTH